jgi:hypothetical protein
MTNDDNCFGSLPRAFFFYIFSISTISLFFCFWELRKTFIIIGHWSQSSPHRPAGSEQRRVSGGDRLDRSGLAPSPVAPVVPDTAGGSVRGVSREDGA